MPRIRFVLSYDGTSYHGFQRQRIGQVTIQSVLENTLSRMSNRRVAIFSSGRTDAGVHARVQVAHADLSERWADTKRLTISMNSLLPADIRVVDAQVVRSDFHALRDVKKKMYVYFINPSVIQTPALARYCWHLRIPLDWNAVMESTKYIVGRHDFRAFAASNMSAKTTIRTVYEASWGNVKIPAFGCDTDLIYFKIVGKGFLKNMVRILVGSMVHVGNRRSKPEQIAKALRSGNRADAGPTAPPQGLWLWDVLY